MYADVLPWDSRDATGVVEVPERLVVVGGGVVACEAAVWMAALGSSVTLVVRGRDCWAAPSRSPARPCWRACASAASRCTLGTSVERRTSGRIRQPTGTGRIHGGTVSLTTSPGDLEADEVLLAIGRVPRLDDIGLTSVDLSADDVTGGRLPEWLYAVGDATGGPPLTHWGKHQARVVGARIAAAAAGEVALRARPRARRCRRWSSATPRSPASG